MLYIDFGNCIKIQQFSILKRIFIHFGSSFYTMKPVSSERRQLLFTTLPHVLFLTLIFFFYKCFTLLWSYFFAYEHCYSPFLLINDFSLILFCPYLPIAFNNPFVACQLFECHRSARVKFLGGNPNFCAKSKLCAISKSC